MLGFDERDLVRWLIGAGFDRVPLHYDLNYSREPVPPERIANWVEGRPNPTMPSLAEAARHALGDRAEEYLARYRQVMTSQPSNLLGATAHVTADAADAREHK